MSAQSSICNISPCRFEYNLFFVTDISGSYTLADLTAALETYGDLEEGEGTAEKSAVDKPVPASSKPTESDSQNEPEEPPEKRRKSQEMTSEVASTSTFGFNTSMLPPESTWEVRPKYNADFYSTGDKVSSFTLRRRRKMSPTVQGMMGEAHLRYVRGELKSAIEICQEIIKERTSVRGLRFLRILVFEVFLTIQILL